MMRNMRRAGSAMSLFLTPTLKGMEVSIFNIISLATMFSSIVLIEEQKWGGAPYMDMMAIRSFLLEVSKAFTRSSNAN